MDGAGRSQSIVRVRAGVGVGSYMRSKIDFWATCPKCGVFGVVGCEYSPNDAARRVERGEPVVVTEEIMVAERESPVLVRTTSEVPGWFQRHCFRCGHDWSTET